MRKQQIPKLIADRNKRDKDQTFDSLSDIAKVLLLFGIMAALTGVAIAIVFVFGLFLRAFP